MSDEVLAKRKFWRMAVLAAIEQVNAIKPRGYRETPVSASRLIEQFHQWGVSAESGYVEFLLDDLELSDFTKRTTAFAAPRYIPDPELAQVFANVRDRFDRMAGNNGVTTLWRDYRDFGLDWLIESLGNIGEIGEAFSELDEESAEHAVTNEVDLAQEDEWAPLPVEYETDDAETAIQALEDAADAIESDNGYSAKYPAERDSIVNSLRNAVAYMRIRGEYTRIYFKYSVMEPLKKVAARLGESATGKVVEAAIKGVQKWITENVFELLNRL